MTAPDWTDWAAALADLPETEHTCPRCGRATRRKLYGLCPDCTGELTGTTEGDACSP